MRVAGYTTATVRAHSLTDFGTLSSAVAFGEFEAMLCSDRCDVTAAVLECLELDVPAHWDCSNKDQHKNSTHLPRCVV